MLLSNSNEQLHSISRGLVPLRVRVDGSTGRRLAFSHCAYPSLVVHRLVLSRMRSSSKKEVFRGTKTREQCCRSLGLFYFRSARMARHRTPRLREHDRRHCCGVEGDDCGRLTRALLRSLCHPDSLLSQGKHLRVSTRGSESCSLGIWSQGLVDHVTGSGRAAAPATDDLSGDRVSHFMAARISSACHVCKGAHYISHRTSPACRSSRGPQTAPVSRTRYSVLVILVRFFT